MLWEQWRATVRRCGLEQETLGRLCPSLYKLPTVIWRTALAEYLNLTVSEMRRLKTHGEKRVQAVLEVFHSVHEILSDKSHNKVICRSQCALSSLWRSITGSTGCLRGKRPPSTSELKKQLVVPVLAQLRIDAGS